MYFLQAKEAEVKHDVRKAIAPIGFVKYTSALEKCAEINEANFWQVLT